MESTIISKNFIPPKKRRRLDGKEKKITNKQLAAIVYRNKPETKYSSQATTTNFDYNGHLDFCGLDAIAQGDDATDRIGETIFLKRVIVRGYIRLNNSGSAQQFARIVVFHWNSTVGESSGSVTEPTVADIIPDKGTALAAWSFYSRANGGRFTILKDEVFAMDASNSAKLFNYNIVINKRIKYPDSDTDNVPTNGIVGVIFLSSEDVNTPVVGFYSRSFYTDS